MKKYKTGDTIYVKGTVKEIDDTSLPYCVDFVNDIVWVPSDDIIDELPATEPVKPVLPKEVGEELDIAKNKFPFDVYIGNVIYDVNSVKASYNYYIDNTNAIIKLADAWRYGYTVEKEPTWYIEVPGKFVRPTYYAINDGYLAFGYLDEDKKGYRDYSAHAFTNEEIKKYDLEKFEKELVADDNED